MMKSTKTLTFLLLAGFLILNGCKKEVNNPNPESGKPFNITDYFLAGTTTSRGGSITNSVFFIQFLEDNKALFINSSTNNLVGKYTLTDTVLTFEVTGGNARIAKFTLDKDKKITSAYYKALTMEYDATGELMAVNETNQFAGKSFKGDEFKMGQTSNRTDLIYNFNKAANITTYGSGIDAATIDVNANNYTLIGASGFKSTNSSGTELGFISNKKLTTSRVTSGGLIYYGKYDQQ